MNDPKAVGWWKSQLFTKEPRIDEFVFRFSSLIRQKCPPVVVFAVTKQFILRGNEEKTVSQDQFLQFSRVFQPFESCLKKCLDNCFVENWVLAPWFHGDDNSLNIEAAGEFFIRFSSQKGGFMTLFYAKDDGSEKKAEITNSTRGFKCQISTIGNKFFATLHEMIEALGETCYIPIMSPFMLATGELFKGTPLLAHWNSALANYGMSIEDGEPVFDEKQIKRKRSKSIEHRRSVEARLALSQQINVERLAGQISNLEKQATRRNSQKGRITRSLSQHSRSKPSPREKSQKRASANLVSGGFLPKDKSRSSLSQHSSKYLKQEKPSEVKEELVAFKKRVDELMEKAGVKSMRDLPPAQLAEVKLLKSKIAKLQSKSPDSEQTPSEEAPSPKQTKWAPLIINHPLPPKGNTNNNIDNNKEEVDVWPENNSPYDGDMESVSDEAVDWMIGGSEWVEKEVQAQKPKDMAEPEQEKEQVKESEKVLAEREAQNLAVTIADAEQQAKETEILARQLKDEETDIELKAKQKDSDPSPVTADEDDDDDVVISDLSDDNDDDDVDISEDKPQKPAADASTDSLSQLIADVAETEEKSPRIVVVEPVKEEEEVSQHSDHQSQHSEEEDSNKEVEPTNPATWKFPESAHDMQARMESIESSWEPRARPAESQQQEDNEQSEQPEEPKQKPKQKPKLETKHEENKKADLEDVELEPAKEKVAAAPAKKKCCVIC